MEETKLNFDADPNQSNEPTPEFVIGGEKPEAQAPEPLEEVQPENIQQDAEDNLQSDEIQEGPEEIQEPKAEAIQEEVLEETQPEPIEEIVEITEIEEEPVAEVREEPAPAQPAELPEGIDKLVEFIKDTGGTLEDYIQLNRDLDKFSDEQLLLEYYAQARPHWSKQDVLDHIEDEFTIDGYEEGDELDREDRRKLRMRKEEIYKAKQFLEGQKDKYYENIKLNSQQQSAQALEQQQAAEQAQRAVREKFEAQTKELFSQDFKGFDFDAGNKKFRVRENAEKLYQSQSDLNNVLGEHLNDDGSVKDMASYHKALYAFQNADKIFSQAYQQGKADAIKERAESTKNIDMTPKTTEQTSAINKKPTLKFDVDPFGLNNNY